MGEPSNGQRYPSPDGSGCRVEIKGNAQGKHTILARLLSSVRVRNSPPTRASIAQLAEHRTCNADVACSTQAAGSNHLCVAQPGLEYSPWTRGTLVQIQSRRPIMQGREVVSRLAHNQEIVGSSPTRCNQSPPHTIGGTMFKIGTTVTSEFGSGTISRTSTRTGRKLYRVNDQWFERSALTLA